MIDEKYMSDKSNSSWLPLTVIMQFSIAKVHNF